MAQESRVKKSLLNARVNLIFYFLTLALSFFSRKIFLDCLGADFVGLTGTLQNLLGFLNLAELGIGSAIGYVLYKPLFDHDEAKINEIISVFGYLYRWIGRIILGAGCILACFLPLIFPDTQFELGIIFFAYFAFLASSLIGYFANYKQTLLGADQKNYVVTAYFQTATIVKTLIQMASAYYTGSYYLWVVIELVFGIIYSFILNWKINQVYPWLRSEVKQGKLLFKKYPEVMRYTKQLFIQKISEVVRTQTLPILIYAFSSLKIVAYYGNYTIITDKLILLLGSVLGGVAASIGNLVAEGNNKNSLKVFWELMSIRFLVSGIFMFSIYLLLPPFISLWLGDEYILSETVLWLLILNILIGLVRMGIEQFLYAFGLFYDIWAPLLGTVIFIFLSILGGHLWGMEGVLFGNCISLILIYLIWKPVFLFTKGFKISISSYWKNFFIYLFILISSFIIAIFIINSIEIINHAKDSWMNWILSSCIIVGIFSLIYFIFMYIGSQGTRDFLKRLKYNKKTI
ncbi:sugar transporter [Bacteroides sp. ET489]|uniref:lipopolysaccharide biosynthesis protein n=1 Tax=Bacteroides sp. ET489 TaxID=3057126 RepID=UPI0026711E4B|nr:sugar transporter [Bacteroides sp. ET489]MDO3391177.1 sugar transporter [Bacteroides sp. ET489]